MRAMIGASVVLGVVACGDPLVDPQTVVGLRILGTKISVSEDAARSHVEPGESAEAEWLVVAEKARTFSGLALWCEAPSGSFGPPNCVEPFHTLDFEGTSDDVVKLPFTLDSAVDGEWVHWIGLCEQGAPQWREAEQRFECPRGEVLSAVYRGNTSPQNANPSFADDQLSFAGEPWAATAGGGAPACSDPDVVQLDNVESATIRLDAGGRDRETIEVDEYGEAPKESLVYTHVTSWPGLERAYSAIEGTSTESSFELDFLNAGGQPDSEGELVRFAMVVRDGRGGSDWLERWFCLRP